MDFFNWINVKFGRYSKLGLFSSIYLKLIIIFVLAFIRYGYEEILSQELLLFNIVRIFLVYFILNVFFNYARLFIIYMYLKRNNYSKDYYDNFTLGINQLSFFFNHAIFILIFINLFFINLRELLTSISIIAVALVLIFKDYISNFLNGITIMFSKELRLKDYVKIGDFKGRITNITFKNIEMKTENGDFVYIPNTLVSGKEIINYSKSSIKNVKLDFTCPSEMQKHYHKIKENLIDKIYTNFSEIVKEKENIYVKIDKIEKDFFNINLEIVLTKHNYKIEEKIKNYVYDEIVKILADFENK